MAKSRKQKAQSGKVKREQQSFVDTAEKATNGTLMAA